MTVSKVYIPMDVVGTAQVAFARDLYDNPIDGIKELCSNALSSIHLALLTTHPTVRQMPKIVFITVNTGKNWNDLTVEDHGLGFKNFLKNIGNEITNDEEKEETDKLRNDPDYIGKFGVGINGALALSQTDEIEIRSVRMDEHGRTSGFITERKIKKDQYGTERIHYTLPEILDSKYILDHVGAKITVKNLKPGYTTKRIGDAIGAWFYRKIFDGYKFLIRDAKTDLDWKTIQPKAICVKHQKQIGTLSNEWPVYSELHANEDAASDIEYCYDVLTKKVVVYIERLEFQASGYAMCHGLMPNLGRSGIKNDEESLYDEFKEIVRQECIRQNFKPRVHKHTNKPKHAKKFTEIAADLISEFYKNHPTLIPPELKAILLPDILAGDSKPIRGWEKKPEPTIEEEEITLPTGEKQKRKKHKHHKRTPVGEGDNRKISLGMTQKSDPSMPWNWIDVRESVIVINAAFPTSPAYRMTFGGETMNLEAWTVLMKVAIVRNAYGPRCDLAMELTKF